MWSKWKVYFSAWFVMGDRKEVIDPWCKLQVLNRLHFNTCVMKWQWNEYQLPADWWLTTELLLIVHSAAQQTLYFKATPSTIVRSPIQTAFGSIFLFECRQTSVQGCGIELRRCVSPADTASRCSVAGEAALSTSTVYYVTGGNTQADTHTCTPTPPLTVSLPLWYWCIKSTRSSTSITYSVHLDIHTKIQFHQHFF